MPYLALAVLSLIACSSDDPAPTPQTSTVQPIPKAPAGSPDVILVSIDTLKASGLSAYGNELPTSPFIDSLAERGVRFSDMHSVTSWTLPAHTTMLTGQAPLTHKVTEDEVMLSPETPVLPELFQKAGYSTAGFVSALYVSRRFSFDRGFDQFDDFGLLSNVASIMDGAPAEQIVDTAISWVQDRDEGEPIFLFLHFYDVHYDYDPPAPYDALFDRPPNDEDTVYGGRGYRYWKDHLPSEEQFVHQRTQYAEAIRYVDDQLARLDATLREKGRKARWVVTSDHGEEFGERGSWGHGLTLYAEQHRVPLIVSGPDVPEGKVVDHPVSTIDIAPTIAHFIEAGGHLEADGVDLFPYMNGKGKDRVIFADTSRSVSNRLSVYQAPWRMEWNLAERTVELFDQSQDPLEARDVSADNAELVQELQRQALAQLGTPWEAKRAGTVVVQKGVILTQDGTPARKQKVKKGDRFLVLPYQAGVTFRYTQKKKKKSLKFRAIEGERPRPDGALVYHPPRENQAELVGEDEDVTKALEALGYLDD